jgi:hypothetical protein
MKLGMKLCGVFNQSAVFSQCVCVCACVWNEFKHMLDRLWHTQMTSFWDIVPCSLVEADWSFGGTYCLLYQEVFHRWWHSYHSLRPMVFTYISISYIRAKQHAVIKVRSLLCYFCVIRTASRHYKFAAVSYNRRLIDFYFFSPVKTRIFVCVGFLVYLKKLF